ncbi:family 16 glycosylhydrolase [Flavobacterium sp. SUN052]|uniref:family 16 glycosylhydrolase n=1 Tax=Flavobacterium sp. SUN052 TaxID=3002441 RepID=UPI00237DF80D|nr:family 16 glycosylhydrolase [Flavobacterium sp. SUN052]MEC4004973.1 family 16 glycosylhydrolase [Flavobacterium sp. SUN052]
MKKNISFILFLFLITQYSFSQVDVVYNNLVWSDEFDVNGPINTNNWFHQTQLPSGGSWFSGELQHYTNRIDNSIVNAGMLNIIAKSEVFTDQGITKNYTSARLNSKFPFKYGRIDVRAKLPIGAGTWPAIWMLGKNINEDGAYYDATYGTTNWPACGEIDIMEHGIFPSQPVDYIQGTLHTPSSFGNSMNNGGTLASDLQNNFHVYSMNWSPFQISFLLDNVVYYTYNPAVKNAATWPFDNEQYLLLNVAMGGTAGTIPSNFTQASMLIDYVRVYQNTLVDTQSPTNFTASVGAVTSSSVELLLNANDNSGTVVYTISYGSTTMTFANPSGVQKSVVIPNLNPNTNYNFTITATDIAGNSYVNNPIVLNATTVGATGCSGTDSVATQGSFTTGYSYTFETIGTDVKITFQLLDTDKVGVVAYLWKQSPFTETPMTNVSGTTFTKTITGQTVGSTINYAVKFAYAGGLSVTKYVSYIVGNNCALNVSTQSQLDKFSFNNPSNDFVLINSELDIDKVEIYTLLGNLVSSTTYNTKKVDVKNLPKGIYLLEMYSGEIKSVKKLIVE